LQGTAAVTRNFHDAFTTIWLLSMWLRASERILRIGLYLMKF